MMNTSEYDPILSEHLFQISFLQFLQVVQIYHPLSFRLEEGWKWTQLEFPQDQLEKLVRTVEICGMILMKLREESPKMLQIKQLIIKIDRNLHALMKLLQRLPFTREPKEQEDLIAKIDQQVLGIRTDYWEALDWFELRSDHLLAAQMEVYRDFPFQKQAAYKKRMLSV